MVYFDSENREITCALSLSLYLSLSLSLSLSLTDFLSLLPVLSSMGFGQLLPNTWGLGVTLNAYLFCRGTKTTIVG